MQEVAVDEYGKLSVNEKQAVLRDGIQVATDEVKGLRSIKVCVQARHYLLQTVSGEEQAVYPGASYYFNCVACVSIVFNSFLLAEPVRWANKPPKITESRVSISSDISSDMCSRGDNNTQDDMPGAGELTAKPYKTFK
ncbi:hypothetical protein F2Q69_00052166 [Brassica cretica]|uniref:Uncharacterized protein n=1 Tax=Brassica cretica TaxID=69181 RepID=A0A8S9MVQ4_BRACR|nr:hypothetical protein F2Q69_00052166 [Brassica cretica]